MIPNLPLIGTKPNERLSHGGRASARPQHKSFTIPQALALGAAALLATASILTNVSSAIARHPDVSGKLVSGSIALAVAILTTIALAGALQALARRQFIIATLAAVTFALSASFSISSALGVLGGARLQSSISHAHVEGERTRLEFERRNAVNELATIAPQRHINEITPELARRLSIPGVDGCTVTNGPISRQHCPVIAALQSELATANRRSAIVGLVDRHDRDLAALGAPTIANKDAAAVAHVLAAFGINTKADTINTGLMVLGVLILEIGASLSLATAQALRTVAPSVPVLRDITPAPVSASLEAVASVPAIVTPASVPAITAPSATVSDAADKIVQLVRDAGGELKVSSKREIARMIESSAPTANRALVALAGVVSVAQMADGIALRVVA